MKTADARVLLTGATGGIGQATAAALVGAGAAVMLVGRSPARLAAQARTLMRERSAAAAGRPQVEWLATELTRTEGLAELSDAAAEWGCNVVIHNAGMPAFGRLETLDAAAMGEVLNLNLLVPMLLTQSLLPHLHSRADARILFIGSVLGRLGLPGYSVYSASKFGLRGFAESLRRELGGTRVGVQYLGPRSTRTAFNSDAATQYNQATATAMDDPAVVGQAVLDLLASGAPERFLGFPEKFAVRLNGLAPALLDGAFAKHRSSLPPLARPEAGGGSGTPSGAASDTDTCSLMQPLATSKS
ncbi:SDR family oxidoreductase [uncultured Xylophilus sp.]|uniref:SDR family oxidoreductase n=1 Tax=uncultured Xylophilus sp. TaxID=296832 RepID=UPI0025CE43D6|nr:SDR family oxidoreductase [uncultured Xylophilus sp.]